MIVPNNYCLNKNDMSLRALMQMNFHLQQKKSSLKTFLNSKRTSGKIFFRLEKCFLTYATFFLIYSSKKKF